jgi:hypothetical protein
MAILLGRPREIARFDRGRDEEPPLGRVQVDIGPLRLPQLARTNEDERRHLQGCDDNGGALVVADGA